VATALDLDDIQGMVAFGYRDLRAACFVLLGIEDAASARPWVATVAGQLALAGANPATVAVNAAFTATGLTRLGLPAEILAMFSAEFAAGMVSPSRTRGLGDVGASAPSAWAWGGPATAPVDLVLLLYAKDQAALDALYASYSQAFRPSGMVEIAKLDTSDHGDSEPFGFRDGISQPAIEGLPSAGTPVNAVKAGEFVLGYPNEYGLLTGRPLVPVPAGGERGLPPDTRGSGLGDLGRNGTYLVIRQLQQDVGGFWQFVDRVARRARDSAPDAGAGVRLAAKIVGRWPSGAPLTLAPDVDDARMAQANDFGYFHEDPLGLRCPVGAHIRRTNPRDSLDPNPGSQASIDVGNRHRILRRGREYGTQLTPEEALAGSANGSAGQRGLYFMCVNANIARQFEFLQRTWVNNPKFNGLYADRDPLVSAQEGSTFTMPGVPVRTRVTGLPAFVTVKGGGYFFLPGIKALRYLGSLSP
jgi:Dyp-type peroxidase family